MYVHVATLPLPADSTVESSSPSLVQNLYCGSGHQYLRNFYTSNYFNVFLMMNMVVDLPLLRFTFLQTSSDIIIS